MQSTFGISSFPCVCPFFIFEHCEVDRKQGERERFDPGPRQGRAKVMWLRRVKGLVLIEKQPDRCADDSFLVHLLIKEVLTIPVL